MPIQLFFLKIPVIKSLSLKYTEAVFFVTASFSFSVVRVSRGILLSFVTNSRNFTSTDLDNCDKRYFTGLGESIFKFRDTISRLSKVVKNLN
jgi:hypothetical protein